jgi:hypothetical protein
MFGSLRENGATAMQSAAALACWIHSLKTVRRFGWLVLISALWSAIFRVRRRSPVV